MILLELFIAFLKIGLFSFGGGYAAIPLIQQEIVNAHNWMDIDTFSNVLVISQMTPGPIGINCATFIGIQMNGIIGAFVATFGFILPSFIIVTILGHFYLKYNNLNIIKNLLKGVRPVIIASIFAAGITLLITSLFGDSVISLKNLNYIQAIIFIFAMYFGLKLKYSPLKIMFISAIFNVIIYFII